MPPQKKKPRRKKKTVPTTDASNNTKGKVFWAEKAYKPGMAYGTNWSQQKKATFVVTRREYSNTGTKAALMDKVTMLQEAYKRKKMEGDMANYKKVKNIPRSKTKLQRIQMKCSWVLGPGTIVSKKLKEKDNANELLLLAESKPKQTNIPTPHTLLRDHVKAPPPNVDCCIDVKKLNHNKHCPNRFTLGRK